MKLTTTVLIATLLFFSMGFACHVNKATQVALCDDVQSGFSLAASQFPDDKLFKELRDDGGAICDAVRAGNSNTIPSLLRAFTPKFDAFVNQHGQSKGLALVDIGVHVLLNHFPVQASVSRGAKRDTLSDYASKPAWGCNFYPERCANGVPKE